MASILVCTQIAIKMALAAYTELPSEGLGREKDNNNKVGMCPKASKNP